MKLRAQSSPLVRPLFIAFSIAVASVLSAQAQNLLLNPSFEDGPPPGKVSWGYSGGDGTQFDVPEWFTPGVTAPGNTGLDNAGSSPAGIDGSFSAFLQSAQAETSGYAAQTTSYVIQSGDTFNLSLLGSPGWTFANPDGILHYSLYYGGDTTTMGTVFGEGDIDLGPYPGSLTPFQTFSVTGITAPVEAVGQFAGIAFYNSSSSTDGGSWIYIDNVSLTAVPEPSTLASILAGGLGLGLVIFMRRKRSSVTMS